MSIHNRVTKLLGVGSPIIQAPMAWIARARLAPTVANARGMDLIEASSGDLTAIRDEIRKMRDLTDQPFGSDMETAVPLTGQVCGRIDAIKPVRQLVAETMPRSQGWRPVTAQPESRP